MPGFTNWIESNCSSAFGLPKPFRCCHGLKGRDLADCSVDALEKEVLHT